MKTCSDCSLQTNLYCSHYECNVLPSEDCENWKAIANKGCSSKEQKMERFVSQHQWKVVELPNSLHSIKFKLPIKLYFDLGRFCIDSDISVKAFCETAIKEKMKKKSKSVKVKDDSYVQGGLFE